MCSDFDYWLDLQTERYMYCEPRYDEPPTETYTGHCICEDCEHKECIYWEDYN